MTLKLIEKQQCHTIPLLFQGEKISIRQRKVYLNFKTRNKRLLIYLNYNLNRKRNSISNDQDKSLMTSEIIIKTYFAPSNSREKY